MRNFIKGEPPTRGGFRIPLIYLVYNVCQMASWLRQEAGGEDEKRHALAHDLGVPFVTFDRHDIEPDAVVVIPEPLCRAHNMLAFRTKDGAVEVALLDLEALEVLQPLRAHLPKLLPRLTTEASIKGGLVRYQQLLKEKFEPLLSQVKHPVHLLRGLLSHALAAGASAIHLDPTHDALQVRYRIGGRLYDGLVLPKDAHASIAQALPTSGSGSIDLGFADTARVQVHTAPSVHGKKIVIHAHRHGNVTPTIESLGLHGEALDRVYRTLARKEGLVLITGMGKTTLIDTLANALDTLHVALLRAHDAAGLRAALKADPDIVVMDDVPDRESARLLVHGAKRGVFVIASASDDIAQEIDADLSIACAVLGRLCTKQFHDTRKLSRSEGEVFERVTSFAPVFNALKDEGKIPADRPWRDVVFAHPVPCSECPDGYKGLVGVYEVADRGGVVGLTFAEDALFKAAEGQTSIEHALDLIQE